MKLALIMIAALLAAALGSLLIFSASSTIEVNPKLAAIGMSTPVTLKIANPHGVREVRAMIRQDGKQYSTVLFSAPTRRVFWQRHHPPQIVSSNIGKQFTPALHDGKAEVSLQVVSNDFRSGTDTVTFPVEVITTPPHISADGAQHYINQGGGELVVFSPTGYFTDSGVQVDRYRFRSFALPGDDKQRFSLFAYPWDLGPDVIPFAYASNPAGALAKATFAFKLTAKAFRSREIELTDDFMKRVVNQIDPSGTGDLLQRFLKINRELRVKNNQTLADLRRETAEKFLFTKEFLQVVPAVQAQFADKRTYIYNGQKVDEQVHLGFDLASTAHMAILAANDGKVVYAGDLGIYGNCIVLDHGYGLQSIYGHMSEISVKKGDSVARSQVMGHSGSTGLAGGDHLHFSMQIDGVQVNPVEWWDAHWIKDRIWSKVR